MTLTEKLLSVIGKGFISITGAGGKTSLMQALADHAVKSGLSVLMTTTTKIQSPVFYAWNADYIFTDEVSILQHPVKRGETVLYAQKCIDVKKLQSPRHEILEILKQRFDLVLCEADGARSLMLKCHSDRDPVILGISDFTIAMLGGTAIKKKAYGEACGYEGESLIDKAFLEGWQGDLLKGSTKGRRIIVCNKADAMDDSQKAVFHAVAWAAPALLASVKEDRIYG